MNALCPSQSNLNRIAIRADVAAPALSRNLVVGGLSILLSLFVLVNLVRGQSYPWDLAAVEQAFVQEQQTLMQEMSSLLGSAPSAQAIQNAQSQYATEIQSQQQIAQELAAVSELQQIPYVTDVTIPSDASSQMADFMSAQADLMNGYAYIHNQQVQSLAASVAPNSVPSTAQMTQLAQIGPDEITAFQQQYASEIQAQQQRAQLVANQLNQTPIPVSPPLVIPPSASPAMQAFLTLHDQLMRQTIEVLNANLTASPTVQAEALSQLQGQNAASIAQLQQLAQNVSQSTNN